MKKTVLSSFIVASFILYSLSQRPQSPTSLQTTPDPIQPLQQQIDAPTSGPSPQPTGSQSSGKYQDGTYTGQAADAYYGLVQVAAVVKGGQLVDITFLQYPNDRQRSMMISHMALPVLRQEAISAQSASVNTVTGATDTSAAFVASLNSALNQAATNSL